MVISLRSILTTIALAAMLLVPSVMFAAHANAQDPSAICEGVGFASTDGQECGTDGEGDAAVQEIIATVINILSIIVGAISVIMIIVGGLRYIASAGDSSRIQAARNTIIYAIVGLIIVLFAQIIVRFVIDRASPGEVG